MPPAAEYWLLNPTNTTIQFDEFLSNVMLLYIQT